MIWLRNDLRLADNPALAQACKAQEVVALYIHEMDAGLRPPGGAARWWLHNSLNALGRDLAEIGIPLLVESGPAQSVLARVLRQIGATELHWNRRYAPASREHDAALKTSLQAQEINVTSHRGNVLVEPWTIQTGQGKPYSVFTPFWKSLKQHEIAQPLAAPSGRAKKFGLVDIDYRQPAWAAKLAPHWAIGEQAATERLADFLDSQVVHYPQERDFPAKEASSRLSPHLHFGEISPRQIWHAAQILAHAKPALAGAIDKFLSELAWRDFSYHQLYHRQDIASVPMQGKYEAMQWRDAPEHLRAWQQGRTGIPIIDAGMRQLWETGTMHNRVRMLVASFLTKNLLIDWRAGESWFWDCLVDADEANNPASWQWVAGSGLDAAPYFRIFNPVTQGERFDPDGAYVRRFVPELAKLDDKWIHRPAEAPTNVLSAAEIGLGETYPRPMLDLKLSRQRALDALSAL
nr:deoxyribodipyrimidine photo-lyase [Devosia faecipullorum]